MTARIARLTSIAATGALVALMLFSAPATAQWNQQDTQGFAASWAYSGGDSGYRLELGAQDFVINAGFFNADDYGSRGDGESYALELGVGPSMFMPEYEGTPFMVGVGGYSFSPDAPDQDDDEAFSMWFGAGDFEHSTKGLFYQYRYILDGPISGSQGIIGWAF
jgi:hypothetical protein